MRAPLPIGTVHNWINCYLIHCRSLLFLSFYLYLSLFVSRQKCGKWEKKRRMASYKLWRRFILGTSKGIKIIADFKSTIDNIHLFRWNALHVLPDTSYIYNSQSQLLNIFIIQHKQITNNKTKIMTPPPPSPSNNKWLMEFIAQSI